MIFQIELQADSNIICGKRPAFMVLLGVDDVGDVIKEQEALDVGKTSDTKLVAESKVELSFQFPTS